MEVFDRLGGYIEKLGSGIRRMIDAMKEHGLKLPQFELKGDLLKVTLEGPGEHFMELAKKAEEIESKSVIAPLRSGYIRSDSADSKSGLQKSSNFYGITMR